MSRSRWQAGSGRHDSLSATVEVDTKYRRPWLVRLDQTASRLFGSAHTDGHRR